MSRARENPERHRLNIALRDVQREQGELFELRRKTGLTVAQQSRLVDLGKLEIALMAAKRDTGRRLMRGL